MTEYVMVRRRGALGPLTMPPGMPRGPYQEPGTGMGDWGATITMLIAEKELGDLMSGVRKVNDQIISAIKSRNDTRKGYQEALNLSKEAVAKYGPPMIGPIPNPRTLPSFMALGTATKGVRVFARQIQLFVALDRVFGSISTALTKAGLSNDANAIDTTLGIMRRFVRETDAMFRLVPAYGNTKQKIRGLAENTLMPQMGITRFNYSNPKWMVAYSKAAEQVVPLANDPEAPRELREAGLGNPMPTLALALIWVIGIISAAVVAAISISKMIDAMNSKAITARQILLASDARKKEVELAMRQGGASSKEILDRMKEIDASSKTTLEQIPDPIDPIGPLLTPISVILGLAIGGKVAGIY